MNRFSAEEDLLSVDDVAGYLEVSKATIYHWCRQGRLPCLKIGKSWRIRRAALENFLSQSERSATLSGQLRSFLTVPDKVIGIAQTPALLRRLDAAFFQVGESRDGLLIKFYGGETDSTDDLRAEFKRNGLDVERLEDEGRFRFSAEHDPLSGRADTLERLMAEEATSGRTVWASFDWVKQVDMDVALKQQEQLAKVADAGQLVVKMGVLEQVLDDWPPATQRQLQTRYAGTMWLSEAGLALSRFTPLQLS
ncbi:MAG TPA: helix-turn-helix domain-containing protein [Rubrobacteraceae bacterium]|nr:helix-turn-helix domain-containing protein [Rubrobacteraceae bacterium]